MVDLIDGSLAFYFKVNNIRPNEITLYRIVTGWCAEGAELI